LPFLVTFCFKTKSDREEIRQKFPTIELKKPPNHFGIEDSSIYRIRDRNKNNGILYHGLRCMGICESMKILDLAPFPWLPIFRPYVATLPDPSRPIAIPWRSLR
jgi:hypothetical protein